MAKWAIVNGETGQLSDICDEADKFEIYEGADSTLRWCEVPDDTTYAHYMVNGNVIHHTETEDLRETRIVERELAYGSIGEQLDMQYRDSVNGTTEWKDHIANVKATTVAPSSIPEYVEDPRKIQQEGRMAWEPYQE